MEGTKPEDAGGRSESDMEQTLIENFIDELLREALPTDQGPHGPTVLGGLIQTIREGVGENLRAGVTTILEMWQRYGYLDTLV